MDSSRGLWSCTVSYSLAQYISQSLMVLKRLSSDYSTVITLEYTSSIFTSAMYYTVQYLQGNLGSPWRKLCTCGPHMQQPPRVPFQSAGWVWYLSQVAHGRICTPRKYMYWSSQGKYYLQIDAHQPWVSLASKRNTGEGKLLFTDILMLINLGWVSHQKELLNMRTSYSVEILSIKAYGLDALR